MYDKILSAVNKNRCVYLVLLNTLEKQMSNNGPPSIEFILLLLALI